ncbi:MAG: hypothetical protein ABW224_01005 [Kibdelosporangium sp.]
MTAILSARKYWCQPGEPILFAMTQAIHNAEYAVEGLERDGTPKRGLAMKALRAVGRGVLTTADLVYSATGDTSSDDRRENSGPKFADVLVSGPDPDCFAAGLLRPWHKQQLPGWEDIEGTWVLTPRRLGWLVPAGLSDKLARQEEKGKPGFTNNLVRATVSLAADVAVGTVKMIGDIGDYPAGKPVELPEVTAGIEIPREQFRSFDVVTAHDGMGRTYLHLSFADGSQLRLQVGFDDYEGARFRTWIAGG